jgi:surface polysaccharide O-acyltransferase-like enzyme
MISSSLKNLNMENKNLSEMSERELENKEKLMRTSYFFMVVTGVVCTLIVLVSSYISKQPFNWTSLLFTTLFPLYLAHNAKKELNGIKAEFDRRRYR